MYLHVLCQLEVPGGDMASARPCMMSRNTCYAITILCSRRITDGLSCYVFTCTVPA